MMVIVGVLKQTGIFEFLALWAAWDGWSARQASPRLGWAIVVLGVAIFAVRLAMYRF